MAIEDPEGKKIVQNLKSFVNLNLISHSGKTSLLPTILICRVTLGKNGETIRGWLTFRQKCHMADHG